MTNKEMALVVLEKFNAFCVEYGRTQFDFLAAQRDAGWISLGIMHELCIMFGIELDSQDEKAFRDNPKANFHQYALDNHLDVQCWPLGTEFMDENNLHMMPEVYKSKAKVKGEASNKPKPVVKPKPKKEVTMDYDNIVFDNQTSIVPADKHEQYWKLCMATVTEVDSDGDLAPVESIMYSLKRLYSGMINPATKQGFSGINPIPVTWVTKPIAIWIKEADLENPNLELPIPGSLLLRMIKSGVVKPKIVVYGRDEKNQFCVKWNAEGRTTVKLEANDVLSGGPESIVMDVVQPSEFGKCIHYGNRVPKEIRVGSNKMATDFVNNFYNHVMRNMAYQLEAMSLYDLVDFLHFIKEMSDQNNGDYSVTPLSENGEYSIHYHAYGTRGGGMEVTFSSKQKVKVEVVNRVYHANAAMNINKDVFSAATCVALELITLTTGRDINFRQIGGYFDAASSMWQSDLTNYGRTPFDDEVLYVRERNTCKSLETGVLNRANPNACMRFPFFQLTKTSFNAGVVVDWFNSRNIPVMTDKYATESAAFGYGAEAQGVYCVLAKDALKYEGITYNDIIESGITNLEEEYVMIFLFENKAAKLLNRHSQAYGSSSADTSQPEHFPIVASPTRMGLSNGKDARIYGRRTRVLISNSSLNGGSGPAAVRAGDWFNPVTNKNEDFKWYYSIKKSCDITITPNMLPKHFMDKLIAKKTGNQDWIDVYIPVLEKALNKKKGQIFNEGDRIFTMFAGMEDFERQLLTQTGYNQSVKLGDATVRRGQLYEQIEINIEVFLERADDLVKLRAPAIKAVAYCENIKFVDGEDKFLKLINHSKQGWECLLGIECLKAQTARAHAYINSNGGGRLFAGRIHMDNGDVIDLSAQDSKYTQWVDDNTHLVTARRKMAKCAYHTVVEMNGGILPHVTVVEEGDTYVIIDEQMQVLFCDLYINMEISSPIEAGGRTVNLGEKLATFSVMDFMQARDLWFDNVGVKDRERLLDVVDMISKNMSNALEDGIPVLDDDERFFNIFHNIIKYRKEGKLITRTGRDFFNQLHMRYPKGLYIVVDGFTFFVDPGVILSVGNFGEGGASMQIAADIENIILSMSFKPEDRGEKWEQAMKGNMAKIKSSFRTWAGFSAYGKGIGQSKSLFKKVGRTHKSSYAMKIMTSFSPELHYDKEIEAPKVLLNPNCSMVQEMIKKGLKNGSIVEVSRMPMTMPVFCKAVLSKNARIAYSTVLPEIWGPSNEGDADGDGCSSEHKPSMTEADAIRLNKHNLSMGGYAAVYGNNMTQWPCAEFVSFKDSWGKKLLSSNPSKIPAAILDYYKTAGGCKFPGNTILQWIPLCNMVEFCVSVSNHYKRWVGVAYGWCSILSFSAAENHFDSVKAICDPNRVNFANKVTGEEEQIKHGLKMLKRESADWLISKKVDKYVEAGNAIHKLLDGLDSASVALAYVWRMCYEGFGLGGYDPQSTEFFNAIDTAAKHNLPKVALDENGKVITMIRRDDLMVYGKPLFAWLEKEFDIPKAAGQRLFIAERIRSAYRTIERNGLRYAQERFDVITIDRAVKYGALRRSTQGSSMVDNLESGLNEDSTSLFQAMESMYDVYMEDHDVDDRPFQNPILADMIAIAADIHNSISQLESYHAEKQNNSMY